MESTTPASEGVASFFLHQIEAHGKQREAADKIHGAQTELLLRRPRVRARTRYEVTETDRRQGDEAEVRSDEESPVLFPQSEHQSTETHVAGDEY